MSIEEEQTTRKRHHFHFFLSLLTQMTAFTVNGEIEMSTILTARASRPQQQAQQHGTSHKTQADDQQQQGMPRSSIRYDRRSTAQTENLSLAPVRSQWDHFCYRCLQIGAGILVVAFIADTAGYTAWKAVSEHWSYGDYPTTHLTTDFGHGGPSHIVAFQNGQYIDIIEVVGKNTANVYAVKISSTTPQRVITLEKEDVNGDGKPDLLLKVEGMEQQPCLLNTGKGFTWSVTR